MQIFKTPEELSSLTGNTVIGAENLTMQNSDIRFNGEDNILFIAKETRLVGSNIKLFGNNSVVFISENSHENKLDISVYNNSVVYIGKNNYFNGTLHITDSEQKNVIIGDDGLFSFGVWIRTADPHLVFSAETKKRINPSKSVFIGDHVWTGQDALILKGSKIASGCIIGAGSVCTGKATGSNETWAGNPAKRISGGIFWDKSCVHAYTDKETAEHAVMNTDEYIFNYSKEEYLSFDFLDEKLSSAKDAKEKFEALKQLESAKTKNRFAVLNTEEKTKHGLFHK